MGTIDASIRDLHQGQSRGKPRTRLSGVLTVSMIATAGVAVLLAGSALRFDGMSEWSVLLALALLAGIGVFSLFGAAVGLVRFSDTPTPIDLVRVYADHLTDGLVIVEAGGAVVYANAAYRRFVDVLAGAPGALPAGSRSSVNMPSDSLEQAFADEPRAAEAYFRLARAAEQGQASEELVQLLKKGRWLRIATQPIDGARPGARPASAPPAKGRPAKGLTAWRLTDVTGERARNDKAQRRLEQGMEYLDNVPLGFLSSSDEGAIDHMNATLMGWLGLDPVRVAAGDLRLGDVIADDAAVLLTSPLRGRDPGPAAASGQELELIRLDIDLARRDGSRLPVRLIHQPIRPNAGPEARARTLVLDRSPGQALDEDGRAAQVRFARFFQSAPFGIATLDRDGHILNANGTFARMFADAKRGGVTSMPKILERVSDQDARQAIEQALASALAGRTLVSPLEVSFGLNREQTRRLYLGPIAHAAQDGANEAGKEAAILYVVDTTEQKALELKFAQSQKMEAVGQLAGGIAHDFNNVLTAIIGFSDLLLQNQRPTDAAYNDIVNIKQNADRAAGLVRQLLAFSRRQTLQAEVLSLAEVVSDFSFMLSRYITEKVNLKLVHGRDLWFVKADETQLEQVLMNLAVNARDAMPDGGVLTIRTRNVGEREAAKLAPLGIEPAEYVLCEAEDTGVGMTAEVLAKIFEPFFSTKDVGKGTGLGLSTVYGIVKQTGGYIFAESAPGKGTVFRVYLPRHVPLVDGPQLRPPKKDKDPPRDLTGTGRVLLVEDEDAVRNFAKRALERQGYEVLEASTGAEALEVMDRVGGQVDVVVSDVVMPEMDGPTLLKVLRKRNPAIKIIFVSGYPEDAFKKNLDDGETFEFLAKPFRLPQLAAKVKETIGR